MKHPSLKLAQEVCPYFDEQLQDAFYEGFIRALDQFPDAMKMLEPDMGIDRGAWADVDDATKWVDELRGDETEQEPVALPEKIYEFVPTPEPELSGRQLQRMKQEAWKRVQEDYMDDPEVCFALGFDAGYDAVARRVEPPEMESGGGFESCPASLEQTDDAEWARHLREPIPCKQPEQEKSRGQI